MTINKVAINRLRTGVPGLDNALGGGLPEFSFNVIAGQPGSGKTTLAHQIMFALASPERPALYITMLGEPPLKMLRYQQQFEFFDNEKVTRSILFINLADDLSSGNLTKVLERIVAEVETYGPGLVFIDSFRSVVLASQNENNPFLNLQQFIQQLGLLMTSWQATSFLIGEYFNETDPNPVFTVADGLIWLRQKTLRNSVVRNIEIVKMRGQPSLPGLHIFRINNGGIKVFTPAYEVPLQHGVGLTTSTERVKTGIVPLDQMMNGGLPRGYSLLIAGPSGSGKSILAASFLAEGERNGETSIIVAFEPRQTGIRGAQVSAMIKSGKVRLMSAPQFDLSVDEIATLLLEEIRNHKVTRVVIDSLSGFELMLAQPTAKIFANRCYAWCAHWQLSASPC